MRILSDLTYPTLIQLEPIVDDRGYFMRHFDASMLEYKTMQDRIMQANVCFNEKKGTLRGLHYQVAPFEEKKIVSCLRGSIFDVAVDIRKDSETYLLLWIVKLHENRNAIFYIPEGFAHGYQTLEDNTLVHYYMSENYHKESERVLRYDDQRVNIQWPYEVENLSERDQL